MKLRAAVVGCGSLANGAHLPNIAASDMFELAAVCDSQPEAAQSAAARWGAGRTCTDWHELTDAPDIDLIVLCTHTNLRGELICEALRRGTPVYTEKPLSDSREEMMNILRAVRKTGVPVCVGHNRRSGPAMLEFRRLLDLARRQGADRGAIIDRNTGRRPALEEERQTQLLIRINDDIRTWKMWIFDDEHGIMLAEMVHFIDLALWLMPAPPVEAYACGSPRGNFTQIIRFHDGSIATLQHSMVGNFDYPKELIEASARNVSIALDHHVEVRQRGLDSQAFRTVFKLAAGGELTAKQGIDGFHEAVDELQRLKAAGGQPPVSFISPNKGHREHLEAFGRHVQGTGDNPCPAEGAIATTNVALKLVQSARTRRPVPIEPEDYDFSGICD